MKKILAALAIISALGGMTSSAFAGIGNGNGNDRGEKRGWEDSGGGYLGDVPRGLNVSGDKGRVDNGWGNGGENLDANTPNSGGEDADGDNDDDRGSANDHR